MESLVAIGIDVHKDKFALVAILLILGAQDQILGEIEVGPDYKETESGVSSWLLPQCSQSRGNASRPTGAMPG